MARTHTERLLVGRSRSVAKRYLAVAVGLFVGTLGMLALVWVLSQLNVSLSFDIFGVGVLWATALLIVGVPAIQAYQNDGLLVSIALGLAVPLAFYLVLTTQNLVYPSEDLLWGIGTALQFGVPAGIIGFLLGVGVRQAHSWWTGKHESGH